MRWQRLKSRARLPKDRGRETAWRFHEEADVSHHSASHRHRRRGAAAVTRCGPGAFVSICSRSCRFMDAGKDPHFELLLRMIADDGHSIPPEKFLSAAARYQLMPAIDRWVVEHAVQTVSEHASCCASTRSASRSTFPATIDRTAGFCRFRRECREQLRSAERIVLFRAHRNRRRSPTWVAPGPSWSGCAEIGSPVRAYR